MKDLEYVLRESLNQKLNHLVGEKVNKRNLAKFNKIVNKFVREVDPIVEKMTKDGYEMNITIEEKI